MFFFLRLTGITNAAVWFGAVLFFTTAAWPAFFSSEMKKILPDSHAGAAAQILVGRFFVVQYWCGAIALLHLVAEWLYAGKPWRNWASYTLAGILCLSLFNGRLVHPKLRGLHLEVYGRRSTPQQREQAAHSARFWLAVMQGSNIVILLGTWAYLWQVSAAETNARFLNAAKLRG